jgi:predicted transposase/invertase (TIGR01784 family)
LLTTFTFVEQLFTRLSRRTNIMTAARQLERRGIEKGRQEGRQEERLTFAKAMLSSGYKTDEIARLTGLSISELHKLS